MTPFATSLPSWTCPCCIGPTDCASVCSGFGEYLIGLRNGIEPRRDQAPPPTLVPSAYPRACTYCSPVESRCVICRQNGGELLPERHVRGGWIGQALQEAPGGRSGTCSARWPRSLCPSVCSGRSWSGFDGCECPRRCQDDDNDRRDSRRRRRRRTQSACGWTKCLAKVDFRHDYRPAAARYPLAQGKKTLVDPHDRDKIIRKACDGRGREAIRESRLIAVAFAGLLRARDRDPDTALDRLRREALRRRDV